MQRVSTLEQVILPRTRKVFGLRRRDSTLMRKEEAQRQPRTGLMQKVIKAKRMDSTHMQKVKVQRRVALAHTQKELRQKRLILLRTLKAITPMHKTMQRMQRDM